MLSSGPHSVYIVFRTIKCVYCLQNHTLCILSSGPHSVYIVFKTTECFHCLQNHTLCSLSSGPYSVFIIFWRAAAMRPSTSSYSAFLVFSQAVCCSSIVFMTMASVLSSGKLPRRRGLLSRNVLVSKSNCKSHQYQSSGNLSLIHISEPTRR